jgi:hypothetical protein
MAFQGLFRRHNEFVVVKPIQLTANDTLEVGTVIDMEKGNVKLFQLRLWFRRRRIGTKGSEWVNQILEGDRRPESASINKKFDIQKLTDTLTAVANVKTETPADNTAEPSNEQEAASTEPEPTAEEIARAKKEAKNKRERERRAAAKLAKGK